MRAFTFLVILAVLFRLRGTRFVRKFLLGFFRGGPLIPHFLFELRVNGV